jgi:branched-subunit amino acid permease
MNSLRRASFAFVFCCCVWLLVCAWAVLTHHGSFFLPAIMPAIVAVTSAALFWLEDSLRRRSGTPAGAYADLILCFINGTIAVQGWNSGKWLMGVSFTVLSVVFAFWWFQKCRDAPQQNGFKTGSARRNER